MSNDHDTKDCTRLQVVGFSWLNTAHFRRKIPAFCVVEHWHALCRLTDAKALLAEKDARIHQIETERDVFMDARQYQIDEIGVVRAQLQAAQARVAVVLPERMPIPELPDYAGRPAHYAKAFDEAMSHNACLDEVARLNQAPATADSDVREVK